MSLPYSEWHCYGCKKATDEVPIEERFSLSLYAGRWCAHCWEKSGYRKDSQEGFDPDNAGEWYEADY